MNFCSCKMCSLLFSLFQYLQYFAYFNFHPVTDNLRFLQTRPNYCISIPDLSFLFFQISYATDGRGF